MYIIIKLIDVKGYSKYMEFTNLEEIRFCETEIEKDDFQSYIVPIQLFKHDTENKEYMFNIFDEDLYEGISSISIIGVNDNEPVLVFDDNIDWFKWVIDVNKIDDDFSKILEKQIINKK